MTEAGKIGDALAKNFFREEYILNNTIGTCPNLASSMILVEGKHFRTNNIPVYFKTFGFRCESTRTDHSLMRPVMFSILGAPVSLLLSICSVLTYILFDLLRNISEAICGPY